MDKQATRRLVELVARARSEGWYEDDDGWREVDALLLVLGPDLPPTSTARRRKQ